MATFVNQTDHNPTIKAAICEVGSHPWHKPRHGGAPKRCPEHRVEVRKKLARERSRRYRAEGRARPYAPRSSIFIAPCKGCGDLFVLAHAKTARRSFCSSSACRMANARSRMLARRARRLTPRNLGT